MTDQWSDKIFDSLLEEMLTNQHPPDLTEQIQQRFREERAQARTSQGVATLQRPSVASSASATNPNPPSSRADSSRRTSFTLHSAAIAVMTLAAGLLMAAGLWKFWDGQHTDQGASASSGTASSGTASSGTASSWVASSGITGSDEQTKVSERALAANGSAERSGSLEQSPRRGPTGDLAADRLAANGQSTAAPAPPREDLSLENLPFNVNETQPAFTSETTSVVAQQSVKPWSDEEVVAWLDERFSTLWARKQVQLEGRLAANEEAARVSMVLTGGTLPPSEAPPRELADKLLRSASFAEHWADRVVTYWLRGTPAADKDNEAGVALRSAIAQQIVARKPWNEIVAGLIDSQPDEPESAFLTLLAGGGNHRLAGRIGSVVLDEALACARCHDASDNGRLISTDQDEYWSLVAIFSGIETHDVAASEAKGQPASEKELVDRQAELFAGGKAPNVFFDRPDGRLQAAQYRLPGGDNWRSVEGASTPRESLARWIASTSVTDQAAVNTAWRLVYGRPLVAQHAALDGEGWTERREMLDALAKQFQAHGRDISRLVGWLVAAQPFRMQSLAIDRQKWLLASDDEIERWNYATVNFASFQPASTNPRQVASLEGALASVVRWSSTRDERRATLAQPGPIPDSRKTKPQGAAASATANKPDEVPATYLLRSLRPSSAQSELIRRLVSSKLTWSQQVEHIAGLVGESGKSGKLQKTADQLLELKNGDRSAVLFQLLQSALLCEETL